MSDKPVILPEVRWTYRRWYTYGLTVVAAVLVACIIFRLDDPRALMWLGLALCGVIVLLALSYLFGATATDVVRLTAAARGGQAAGDDA